MFLNNDDVLYSKQCPLTAYEDLFDGIAGWSMIEGVSMGLPALIVGDLTPVRKGLL